jgi:hypothetical protein
MLSNGLLNLMNRSTCFGHYYAHHQELATIQTAPACGTSPWLWQVAGLVRGILQHPSNRTLKPTAMHQTSNLMNRSTCFGRYYAHNQEFATIQAAPACGTSPWLWQVAGLVHGCRLGATRWGRLYSLKLLMMDIMMPETCWAIHKVQ